MAESARKRGRAAHAAKAKAKSRPALSRWTKVFLGELAATSNVSASARKAGISTTTAYDTRRSSPEFNRAWQQALCEGYEHLEMELLHPIAMQGITLRPLAPVHPRAVTLADNSLALDWTRRARGGWSWLDGVDVPLHEQAEAYLVSYGPIDTPLAMWEITSTNIVIDAARRTSLAAALPGGAFRVRQKGTYALSEPLVLATLP